MKGYNYFLPLLKTIISFISMVFLFGAFYYSHLTYTNSIQLTSPSLLAYINSDESGNLSAGRIAWNQGEDITLCILNTGELETGDVHAGVYSDWAFSDTFNFGNIPPKESRCDQGFIKSGECLNGEICNSLNVPLGKLDLTFNISCPNCIEKSFQRNIGVCIWKDIVTECN